jgi:hypothetical protein
MKIERVEVFGVAVPLIGKYKNACVSKSIEKSAIVRIAATGGFRQPRVAGRTRPWRYTDETKIARYRFEAKAAA